MFSLCTYMYMYMYICAVLIRTHDLCQTLPLTCVSLYVPTSCMRPAIHENLRKKVQAVSVQYDQDKKMLIVLVSSGRRV